MKIEAKPVMILEEGDHVKTSLGVGKVISTEELYYPNGIYHRQIIYVQLKFNRTTMIPEELVMFETENVLPIPYVIYEESMI